MAGNTFGEVFKVTTFGESHGLSLGCIIDGCPAGLQIDEDFLQSEMRRRRPGTGGASVTARKEEDKAVILSGVFEGKSTGTPIAIEIQNTNQHSGDYSNIKDVFRPGHADFTYYSKYGERDYRGGGRSSGRETCARVAAGAIAKMFLSEYGIKITAYTIKAGGISCTKKDFSQIEQNPLRAPDNEAAQKMTERIETLKKEGNSCGGIIECTVSSEGKLPVGLGEPVFDRLDAVLSHAIVSIGAVKGIEFGKGFESADLTGRENNDGMSEGFTFNTNNAGGILGGISNGNEIVFRAAVKPVPSIYTEQKTVTKDGKDTTIAIQGRHDVCLCPRIVPVIEAMTAITLTDMILRNRASRI